MAETPGQLSKADSSGLSLVLMDAALRCRGVQLALQLFGDTWVPCAPVTPLEPAPLLIEWRVLLDERADSVLVLPDAPVPIASVG